MVRSLGKYIALFAICALGSYLVLSPKTQTPSGEQTFELPMAAMAQDTSLNGTDDAVEAAGVTEMVLGNPEADVELIEYASFTCPHCASFHAEQFKQLETDYIETGKIKFVFREVYFDKYGMWASMIARCAGPVRFFGITDMMFEKQGEWARANGDLAIVNELRKIGKIAGLTDENLDSCLQDGDKLRALVEWYQANATEHDIRSTPSLVLNGKTYKNMAYADLADLLDKELGQK